VALVTFNHNVMIHDLKMSSPYTFVLGGRKQYAPEKLQTLLELKDAERFNFMPNKFVMPLDECRDKILTIIRSLKGEQFSNKKQSRTARASG
jgi:hypothetical protein